MSFNMKYPMRHDLLPIGTKRRSGIKMPRIRFVVDHDTGNPNSTAQGNVNYYKNSANTQSASAHVFIDDKEIIICVPLYEKAWHVLYNKTQDNRLFGDDANDVAIGVELCYFPNDKARSMKAYEKYVWFNAWLAHEYKLNISKDFVGHSTLDPGRKTDPENAFRYIGKSFDRFLKDVANEYNECTRTNSDPLDKGYLMYDDRGESVIELKEKLNKVGYRITVSNYFNNDTRVALTQFQESRGLEADGVYGKASIAELNKAIKEKQDAAIKPISVVKPSVANPLPTKEGIRMFNPTRKTLNDEIIALLEKAQKDGIIKSDEWKQKAAKGELPLDDAVGLLATYLNRTHK